MGRKLPDGARSGGAKPQLKALSQGFSRFAMPVRAALDARFGQTGTPEADSAHLIGPRSADGGVRLL
jgi:hypothetical protein